MPKQQLAKTFDESAVRQSPLTMPKDYAALLEKLVTQGEGFGKTQPVAAYLLRNLQLVTGADDAQAAQDVKVEPLYVVMDIKEWPNEYARSLVMQDVMMNYAKRVMGEEHINAPDFNGHGIWTVKKKNFEFEYQREDGLNENGRRTNVYQPDPAAHRLCLRIDTPLRIPTAWGKPWEIGAGGTLAVREKDVPALTKALMDIQTGRKTAEEALLRQDPKTGKIFSRFDVYGMAPGFLENNYKPVPLKPETKKCAAQITNPRTKSKNPAAAGKKHCPAVKS